ncbi:MAG: HlyD family efflux transporter periplasmic adaptor subunit [Gammaproteobacteria bacterium]|nr:HlyD family efflux transporter periplasmic adaptor subunit [Gammaproteobacteria bacterium]
MSALRRVFSFQSLFVLILVAAGSWFAVQEFRERLVFVKETDARITAQLVTVSSRVDGWLTQLHAEEGQQVKRDAPIASLDDRAARLQLTQLEAQRGGIEAEQRRLDAESQMVEEQTRMLLATRASRVRAAEAVVQSLKPQLDLAREELARVQSLYKDGVASKQSLDQARTLVHQLHGQYLSAVARHAEAQGEMAEAQASRARVDVLASEAEKLRHRAAQITGEIEENRLAIGDRVVPSPLTGVVDRVFVEPGEYLRAGQRIALIHDPKHMWIEANIKETELRRLRPEQPVHIVVDAYPEAQLSGRVERIGQATTSTFALLPNPNPSGNFTKITQRVPVRIVIEQTDKRLRPGLMAEVHIDVR